MEEKFKNEKARILTREESDTVTSTLNKEIDEQEDYAIKVDQKNYTRTQLDKN